MKKSLLAASLFFIVLFACKTKENNKTIVYDSKGRIDTIFTHYYRPADTLQIPSLNDPSIFFDTIIGGATTEFKNYDKGKLVSSGFVNDIWSVKYFQKSSIVEVLPNGNKLKTEKLGPNITRQITYRPDGTKLYEDNPVKYTYTIYDAKGKIDTLKYDLRCDTLYIPDLYDPSILHDTILCMPKFKHYSGKKLVSSGKLCGNKPCGQITLHQVIINN